MTELRTILADTTSRSLVLIDELCRGTEVQKGTAIAASVIESLDRIGCLGILSTHLHDLLDMKLRVRNVVQKSMGVKDVDGHIEPTWKLVDGACRESLAFEVAKKEGVPDSVVQRAIEIYRETLESKKKSNLYSSLVENGANEAQNIIEEAILYNNSPLLPEVNKTVIKIVKPRKELLDHMEIFSSICKKKLLELGEGNYPSTCSFVGPRQLPPPSTTMHSCVYLLQRPDGRFYVGQSDNLTGRVRQHRSTLADAPFLYLIVPNKSVASELETCLIHQLPALGINLVNKGDQNHRHFGTAPLVDAPPF